MCIRGDFIAKKLKNPVMHLHVKMSKHVGTLRSLFEKVRNRIDIAVWDSWHALYTFIGDVSARPPPGDKGWLIG